MWKGPAGTTSTWQDGERPAPTREAVGLTRQTSLGYTVATRPTTRVQDDSRSTARTTVRCIPFTRPVRITACVMVRCGLSVPIFPFGHLRDWLLRVRVRRLENFEKGA